MQTPTSRQFTAAIMAVLGVVAFLNLQSASAEPSSVAVGGFVPVSSLKIADTRSGQGGLPVARLGNNVTVSIPVAGVGGVPASAKAVLLSVVALTPSATGGLYVSSDGTAVGGDVTYNANITSSNTVLSQVNANGRIYVKNTGGPVDVVVELEGYFGGDGTTSGLNFQSAARILNTRDGTGGFSTPLANGATYDIATQAPAGSSAVFVNVTAVSATGNGWFWAWARGAAQPGAAQMAYVANSSTTIGIIVPVDADGYIRIKNQGPSVDVVIDVEAAVSAGSAGSWRTDQTRIFSYPTNGVIPPQGSTVVNTGNLGGYAGTFRMPLMVTATVIAPTAHGSLYIYGGDEVDGTQVSFSPGPNRSNFLLLEPSVSGQYTIKSNSTGEVRLILDTQAFFVYTNADPSDGRNFPQGQQVTASQDLDEDYLPTDYAPDPTLTPTQMSAARTLVQQDPDVAALLASNTSGPMGYSFAEIIPWMDDSNFLIGAAVNVRFASQLTTNSAELNAVHTDARVPTRYQRARLRVTATAIPNAHVLVDLTSSSVAGMQLGYSQTMTSNVGAETEPPGPNLGTGEPPPSQSTLAVISQYPYPDFAAEGDNAS